MTKGGEDMIAWKYLDKQQATLNALRDFENMTCIINLTPDKIKSAEEDMVSPRSNNIDDMPHSRNVHSHEDKIINSICNIDVLRQRYIQAVEFMDWFKPAWDTLSQEEQIILSEFYLVSGKNTGGVESLCEILFIDRSNVYRRKDKAINHLSIMLYGY